MSRSCGILPVTLLASAFLMLAGSDPANARQSEYGMVEGSIKHAETGEPLRGAHVFLSGTQIGTVTNEGGRFRISRIPPGAHRLIVTSIGFGRLAEEMIIRRDESISFEREMEPVIYEMEALFVGNLDDRWERYLERFYRLFIGQSTLSDSVRIVNPEVLRFESRWWGRFTAEALAPLVIENRSLGYRVIYHLDEFHHSGLVTRWDGDPLFEELAPRSDEEAERWETNRRDAFYGSMRHFLISLIQNRLEDEGFEIYRTTRDQRPGLEPRRLPVSPDRILKAHEEDPVWLLNYYGKLRVYYAEAEEDVRYPEWADRQGHQPASFQTSDVSLNLHPIHVDADGEILETYGATKFGYFSFLRIADKTPREYRPEDLPDYLLTDTGP